MNINIAIGTIARVNFLEEIIQRGFPGMAVIKASPEMGFLVWLNGYGGSYSRTVTVSKSLGDISISKDFYTVGNLYYLSPNSTTDEFDLELNKLEESGRRVEAQELYIQMRYRHIAEPIHDACRRLGITKLWKHCGNSIPNNHDLIIMDLTERGQIDIETQC
jgi:hypothetical protein